MSFFVELPLETYPADALDGLDITTSKFRPENAQAMMWLSQLAYETGDQDKVDKILGRWHLARRAFGSNDPVTGLPPHSACFVVAGGHKATFVTFSGTDPLKIEDWITDFTVAPEPNVLHAGFDAALDSVWPAIETAIRNRDAAEQPLFFTGHSLGGALAILAAERALNRAGIPPTAVYTFGSPRTGGQDFFDRYPAKLANSTFRLVNGDDIVPTVPPILGGDFRHVGQMLHCRSGGRFAGLSLAPSDGNDPDIIQSALDAVVDVVQALVTRRILASVGPRLLGQLAGLLPTMVRDHIPASYFQALSITLK